MKRVFLSLFATLLVCLSIVSCSNEEDINETDNQSEQMELSLPKALGEFILNNGAKESTIHIYVDDQEFMVKDATKNYISSDYFTDADGGGDCKKTFYKTILGSNITDVTKKLEAYFFEVHTRANGRKYTFSYDLSEYSASVSWKYTDC